MVLMVEALQEDIEMNQLWDERCRNYYKEHFDCRRNKVDWDYWMRLCEKDKETGIADKSIIHPQEFISWRLTGTAYRFKEGNATEPNRTLLSSIPARTKEYKNRLAI